MLRDEAEQGFDRRMDMPAAGMELHIVAGDVALPAEVLSESFQPDVLGMVEQSERPAVPGFGEEQGVDRGQARPGDAFLDVVALLRRVERAGAGVELVRRADAGDGEGMGQDARRRPPESAQRRDDAIARPHPGIGVEAPGRSDGDADLVADGDGPQQLLRGRAARLGRREGRRDDRGAGMTARDAMAIVEIERRRGGGVAPDRAGEAGPLPGEPDGKGSAGHGRGGHPPDGARARRIDAGQRCGDEVEDGATGRLAQIIRQRVLSGLGDIGCEPAHRLHDGTFGFSAASAWSLR